MTGPWEGLAAALLRSPSLPRAVCTELPRLFDWDWTVDDETEPRNVRAQRHDQAVDICSVCPALTRCGEWAATLRPTEILGVIAGQIHSPTGIKTRRTAA